MGSAKIEVMPKFNLGKLYMSAQVSDRCATDLEFSKFILTSIKRHSVGDWGDLSSVDKLENEFSLGKYLRLFSAYKSGSEKIWIITEADRSATTVIFPSEY